MPEGGGGEGGQRGAPTCLFRAGHRVVTDPERNGKWGEGVATCAGRHKKTASPGAASTEARWLRCQLAADRQGWQRGWQLTAGLTKEGCVSSLLQHATMLECGHGCRLAC